MGKEEKSVEGALGDSLVASFKLVSRKSGTEDKCFKATQKNASKRAKRQKKELKKLFKEGIITKEQYWEKFYEITKKEWDSEDRLLQTQEKIKLSSIFREQSKALELCGS